MANTLESIIGGIPIIGGIAQSIINSNQARENQEKQNQANLQLAQYQYSKDLEMWNRGNEYNAPQAQMQRLRDAGLNPNLVYGSGAVAGQSAGQIPKYQAPQMEYNYPPPVDIPNTIGIHQDVQIKQAQLDNLRAQRNAIAQDTLLKTIEANYRPQRYDQQYRIGETKQNMMATEAGTKFIQQELLKKSAPYQLEGLTLKNRLSEQQLQKQLFEIAKISADTEYKKLQTDMFMPSWWANTAVRGVSALKSLSKGGKVPAQLNQKITRGGTAAPWKKLEPGYGLKRRIQYVRPRK